MWDLSSLFHFLIRDHVFRINIHNLLVIAMPHADPDAPPANADDHSGNLLQSPAA
jgi:hypothetical protein